MRIIFMLLLSILVNQALYAITIDDLKIKTAQVLRDNSALTSIRNQVDINFLENKIPKNSQIQNIELLSLDKRRKIFSIKLTYHLHKRTYIQNLSGAFREIIILPTLNTNLKNNEIINESQIHLMSFDSTSVKKNAITKIEDLIGKTPKNHILAYSAIENNDVMLPNIVKKGQIITVSYVNNNLTIKMNAQAMESGSLGDIIKVKNLKTNSLIIARVTEQSAAEIQSAH